MKSLSKRLSAVALLVENGAVVADIGTDHGLVPVYLIKKGVISSAVAADINEGPLDSCRSLVKENGLDAYISVRLSDGLDNIKSSEFDTVIIAGMGGELICKILSRADLKHKHIILNPMTHPETVREFLYSNGFEIGRDLIIHDGRHYYCVFEARFTGGNAVRSRIDYYLGNIKDFSNKGYFQHLLNYLKNKQKSGEDLNEVIKAVTAVYDNG